MLVNAGDKQALRFVNNLQEVDDAKLLYRSGKPGQIRKHDGPSFPKQIPNASVNLFFISSGFQPLGHQFFQPVQVSARINFFTGLHSQSSLAILRAAQRISLYHKKSAASS